MKRFCTNISFAQVQFGHTLKNYKKKNLPKDILAGIIIAAVSIPIAMGYAQIAGLPAVYGLYGSVSRLFCLRSFPPRRSLSLAWTPRLRR